MKALTSFLLLVVGATLLVIVSSSTHAAESRRPSPSETWQTATPEEIGIDSVPLVEMFDFVRDRQISVHSIQLVRCGRLVLDAYFYPYDGRTRHDVASVTKSFTSTLVGLAIERGHIRDVQESVLGFFPERTIAGLDARKRKQTLEHLLTMLSGWDCGVPLGTPSINADRQLAEMRRRDDWAQFALELPMTSEPGTRFLYCNANCHLLSALLTRVTGTNALAFARRELFEPLGIRDIAWPADPQGNNYGWGDLQLHPRDMARLGQLFLQRGRWAGRQIIPEDWLRAATRAHVERTGGKDRYGYYWWVSDKLPGLFEAVGRGGQRITVWPDKELVLVYTGGGFEPGDLATLILQFDKPSEATVRFQRLGQELRCPVGLDGVERFSIDTLVELPFACKGRWLNDNTFLLELERVAGISLYRFKLSFADEGNSVTIALGERTGMGEEIFDGRTKP